MLGLLAGLLLAFLGGAVLLALLVVLVSLLSRATGPRPGPDEESALGGHHLSAHPAAAVAPRNG